MNTRSIPEDPVPVSPSPAAVQRRTLVVLVAMQVIGTVGVGVAPSIGVLLAGEVAGDEAWAGLARTASTLGAALFGLPLGTLAARRGRRAALSTGWWTAASGGALLVLAAQLSLVAPLFVGLLLIGAGSAVSLQARFAATDLAEPAHRGRALALVVWVGTLGSVVGPNLGVPGEAISRATGLTVFASAFLVAAVCLALAGVVAFAWLRPDPLSFVAHEADALDAAPAEAPRGGRIRLILVELRHSPGARYAVVAILTAQIVMVAVMTMTPVHIAHEGGSVTVVGVTISLHIVGMYALSPLVGLLADRLGARPTIGIGIAVLLASLAIGAALPDDMGAIVASLILLGVGWSFANVAGSALFSASVPPAARASSQGGVDAMANLCGATAALAAGPLLAATSFATLSLVSMALLVPLAAMTLRRPPSSGGREAAPEQA
ncbi:MFS transporter [Microbacterium sp. gxy059]|uniref:MFS transporter n=1 Tax=Microbacterium sp. gxy059 TaxID=2957199 RepID=UPI003D99351F